MSATVDLENEAVELQLDELIPPPAGPGRKLAVGATVVVVAIALSALNIGGFLYPRPTFGTSFDSGSYLEADRGRQAVGAQVMMPNNSRRSVRITTVALDAPGASLVDARVFIERPISGDRSGTLSAGEPVAVDGTRFEDSLPLPVVIAPGDIAMLVLWFQPLDCVDRPAPWGVAEVTMDFGDGAFPPFARTVRIKQDPIGSGDEQVSIMVDGDFLTASGPLAAACEALR